MKSPKSSVVDILQDMEPWTKELMLLRKIILSTGLKEEVKWGGPVYTWEGKNVVAIGGWKHFFTLWFHQGVFLSDSAGVLVNAGEGRTRGLRQWRMTSAAEVRPALVKKYVMEAMKNAKAGKEIRPEKKKTLAMPDAWAAAFKKDKALKASFDLLTPGKQREYLEYIIEAKTEPTRQRRIEKCIPIIRSGAGLNDRYK